MPGHYLPVHEVDGAPDVDVHEVYLDGAVQELRTLGHGVGEGAFKLRPVAGQRSGAGPGCPLLDAAHGGT